MKSTFWLLLFVVLSAVTRCSNYADVFVNGQIYFVDADCYSRMTRVQAVLEHPGTILRHHDFENYPQGTDPHTTAPMDYLIAVLAWLLKPFAKNHVDLAGAIISPLLGVMTTAFLWYWSRELHQRYRRVMLLLVSLSPIIVHGTILGRPDHQSLLIFLMAVALAAELAQAGTPSVKWSVLAGIAWGLGLWVSLYEPLILMGTILGAKLIFFRSQLFVPERWRGNIVMLAILAVAFLIERWHVQVPDETTLRYFQHWKQTVGELSTVGVFSPLLFRWVGFGLLVAPLLLLARIRDAKRSVLLLVLLAVTFGLTIAQVRWGYFFALVFAMSLPWQLSLFKTQWPVWIVFMLSLWPVLREWEDRIFPNEERAGGLAQQRTTNILLRDAAEHLRGETRRPLLAAWWLTPALVYWSGQPGIAGSSHESLSGSVDAARFFFAADIPDALALVKQRAVGAIVASEPSQLVETSAALLFQPAPSNTVAQTLFERPHSAPPPLKAVYTNPAFKVFLVDESPSR